MAVFCETFNTTVFPAITLTFTAPAMSVHNWITDIFNTAHRTAGLIAELSLHKNTLCLLQDNVLSILNF
jgi:hypothetical protein